ncbi:MAG: HD domain-containing protein [Phocaeicola sp.]|nr:HD domain-containing protein [Phocaeicola sp.]
MQSTTNQDLSTVNPSLIKYVEKEILPLYDSFDAAHQRGHARAVIEESMRLASFYEVNPNIVYATAAYHDTGLQIDRELHHIYSGRRIRSDRNLLQWFTEEEIETIAQAAEDHRASSKEEPRSIYGKIVADADKELQPINCIRRAVQYTSSHYPDLSEEEQYMRSAGHLQEKYAEGGYMHLWLKESREAPFLSDLRSIINDEKRLREVIFQLMKEK